MLTIIILTWALAATVCALRENAAHCHWKYVAENSNRLLTKLTSYHQGQDRTEAFPRAELPPGRGE
jgi:hypothetical protein